ncbi:alanine racemase [Alkalicaulis satelles]|uniref:Alanine racemase n=1 Tax=Alkalicaulis satelles TaxID=2609175 RepID=A0A5M6ZN62_9PROT|nr:alanine racemase [Alkalicaulis satelles]KAA5805024.1 alanine racemase [Alkalicaulis satelles]
MDETHPDAPAAAHGLSARLIIDRDALARNFQRLQAMARGAETGASIKADAYGLGAAALAPRLAREGCRTFFTATPEEGAELRRSLGGGEADIWVLNGYDRAQRAVYVEQRLGAVLNQACELADFADEPAGPCALHLDTGMNRLGFSPQETEDLIAAPGVLEDLDLRVIMSHLACSEEPSNPMNAAQRERFTALAGRLPKARLSLANTGGVMLGEAYHFDLARPGIGLYGASASLAEPHPFEPVARLEAPLVQLRQLQPGDSVGYGASFTAGRPMTVATAAVGYGDGLPRALSGKGFARIADRRAPILGRVSMDLVVLDVSDCEAEARAGAPAVFLGEDLTETAKLAGALPYELLTGLGLRPARVYEGAP